jgi:hypothetical protein
VLALSAGASGGLGLECGLIASDSTGGGGQDSGVVDAGPSSPPLRDLIADAGICASPSGWAVCNGPNHCFPDAGVPLCVMCSTSDFTQAFKDAYAPPALGMCSNDASLPDFVIGAGCSFDECVNVEAFLPGRWGALPFEVGPLFAANGASDRVRYADMSFWTGDALPPVPSCSIGPGVQGCGGSCPPCANGLSCTGRSPLHPVGICASFQVSPQGGCTPEDVCPSGQSCFTFRVQPDAQAEANSNGFCFSSEACKILSTQLPGGGYCSDASP